MHLFWIRIANYEGREDVIPPKAGHYRPVSKTPFNGVSLAGRLWSNIVCCLRSFVIFQGIRTRIAKIEKTYCFVIFQGRGVSEPPVPSSGSAHIFDCIISWSQYFFKILTILTLKAPRKNASENVDCLSRLLQIIV